MAITYVGGKTGGRTGSTSLGLTLDLTTLTGGSGGNPQTGDVILVSIATGSVADRSVGMATPASGWTETETYSNDTIDCNFVFAWMVCGASPPTSIVTDPSGNNLDGLGACVQVWRGAVAANPRDVATQSANGVDTGQPTPPAITPVSKGAVIICGGGASATTGVAFSSSDLSNFISNFGADDYDGVAGMGSYAWTSGTFTPAKWTGNSTSSTLGWGAASFVLRPKVVVVSDPVETLSLAEQAPTIELVTGAPSISVSTNLALADELDELKIGQVQDKPTEETLLLADALQELRIGQVKPTTPMTDTADFADGLSDLRIGPVVVKPEDLLTLADALSDLRPSGVKYDVVQETLALTDAVGELKVGAVVLLLADVLSLAEDAQQEIGGVLAQVLDTLGLADDATVYVEGGAPGISVTDSLSLADSLTAPQVGGLLIELAESLVATEELKTPKVGSLIIVGTETVDAADALTTPKIGTVIVLVNDALVAVDDAIPFTGDPSIVYVNFSDALSLTEAINAMPSGVQAIVYDALGITDSIAWGGQNNLTFADALVVLVPLNAPKIGNLIVSLTETLTAAEIATEALGQTTFTVTDSISAVDVLSKTLSDLRLSLYDDLTVSEDLAARLSNLKVAVEDTLTLIEVYLSYGLGAGLQPVDSLKLVESLIVQIELLASQIYEVQGRLRAYRATPRARAYVATNRKRYARARGVARARAYVATNRKRQFTGKEH